MIQGREPSGSADIDLAARWARLAAVRDSAIAAVRVRISRPDDAEDLVHEALLRLAGRDVLDVDHPGLRSLVVTTACALAIDGWRRARRRERLLGRLGVGAEQSPETRVADRSEAAWLAAGLPDLGQLERAAILYAADGEPVGEIARLLGVGYKAAENALCRARRKLRLRAVAAALGLAGLLRRLAARPEGTQAVAMVPVLAVAVLLAPGLRQHSAPAPRATPVRLVAFARPSPLRAPADVHSAGATLVAGASGSRGAAPRTPAAVAPPVVPPAGGGGGQPPAGHIVPPVPVRPMPEGGTLLIVDGQPLAAQPSTTVWVQTSRKACDASSAACFPISVP